MTNQERVDEAKRLMSTGKHQDLKRAKKLLAEVKKEDAIATDSQQINLFKPYADRRL